MARLLPFRNRLRNVSLHGLFPQVVDQGAEDCLQADVLPGQSLGLLLSRGGGRDTRKQLLRVMNSSRPLRHIKRV